MSDKLSELVKRGESEEVEFKKSTAQLDRALKSVCSFLNHKGGRVYFGISKGKIDGQDVSEQTLKSISQKIRQRIKAVEYLKINKTLTSKKYAELFSITDRMARNDLRELINKKIIKRKGVSDKTTYYILAEI